MTQPQGSPRDNHVSNSEAQGSSTQPVAGTGHQKKRERPKGSKNKEPRQNERARVAEQSAPQRQDNVLASRAIEELLASTPRVGPLPAELVDPAIRTIIDEENQERERTAERILAPICDLCGRRLPRDVFEKNFRGRSIWQQEKECVRHTKAFAMETWETKGYPEIRWDLLKVRCLLRDDIIRNAITGKDCLFRQRFEKIIERREDRFVNSAEKLPIPGYYGMKGFSLMSEAITEEYATELHRHSIDPLIRARGMVSFLHYVILPEVAVDLIMEDTGKPWQQALALMEESAEVGVILHGDDSDEISDHISV